MRRRHDLDAAGVVSRIGRPQLERHVVREAKTVTVKLFDRREFTAKVLGSDPVTDIAVLRIDAKDLPTVRLGNPKQIEVGDPVLAIGSPFGLEQTATQGIVSAKGRSLPGDAVVPFLPTDAAVNPGNSGGPLFDGSGQVIGINAQIYSQSGGYQGLAFAIPIDVALKVKDQIVATGRAQHARLGVTVQELNQALAESFGLPRAEGALVASVAPNSAAAAAGLKCARQQAEERGAAGAARRRAHLRAGEPRLSMPYSGYSSDSISTIGPSCSSAWPMRPEGSTRRNSSVAPKTSP